MDKQYDLQAFVLADGTRVRVRSIRPDDAPRLQAFMARLSPQTIYRRTNLRRPPLLSDGEARDLAHVDYHSTMALVAVTGVGSCEKIVGEARYANDLASHGEAEVGVLVEDAYQRQGIGVQLLMRLAAYARQQGFNSLAGHISAENQAVLSLIRRTGLSVDYLDVGYGDCQVVMSLAQPMRLPVRTRAGGKFLTRLRCYWARRPRWAPA